MHRGQGPAARALLLGLREGNEGGKGVSMRRGAFDNMKGAPKEANDCRRRPKRRWTMGIHQASS